MIFSIRTRNRNLLLTLHIIVFSTRDDENEFLESPTVRIDRLPRAYSFHTQHFRRKPFRRHQIRCIHIFFFVHKRTAKG